MSDYKYEMQMRAEDIAVERYGCEFYELPKDKQGEVFNEAMGDWYNAQSVRADYLNDVARET